MIDIMEAIIQNFFVMLFSLYITILKSFDLNNAVFLYAEENG